MTEVSSTRSRCIMQWHTKSWLCREFVCYHAGYMHQMGLINNIQAQDTVSFSPHVTLEPLAFLTFQKSLYCQSEDTSLQRDLHWLTFIEHITVHPCYYHLYSTTHLLIFLNFILDGVFIFRLCKKN